jgi:hypothetical protein
MEERFALFEQYCLPSVLGQSDQNFRWHIYFDRNTPETYLRRAQQNVGDRNNILIRLCDIYGSETVKEDLPIDLEPPHEWLVTTRLDNDDRLDRDFVLCLRRSVRVGTVEALNFPLGYVLHGNKFYLSRQESNAFISLSEPFANIRTVLCTPHNEMSRFFPLREIEGGVAWLQVIHGSNVSNKVRGVRVARSRVSDGFTKAGASPDACARESPIAIAAENATSGLARLARDRLAAILRRLVRP